MPERRIRPGLLYSALAAAAALIATLLSFTAIATQFDNNLYDFFFRLAPKPPASAEAALLVFDEAAFRQHNGLRGLRRTLAAALDALPPLEPKAVAVDLTLADSSDPEDDDALAAAFARTRNLALATEMTSDASAWQDPLPAFLLNAALGHVSTLAGPYDDINRRITLERVAARTRRWALSLEAFRLSEQAGDILSSPSDVTVGPVTILSRWDEGRPMRVHYRPESIPRVSVADLLAGRNTTPLRRRVVFVGVTALSAVPDRLFTPLSRGIPMPGVEIHAQAFQTIADRAFLDDLPPSFSLASALIAAGLAALIFTFFMGWPALILAGILLIFSLIFPYGLFLRGLVLAPTAPIAASWIATLSCASLQYFWVRRRMAGAEATRDRYQQAFRFVAHELRTPLTAIQGSSELMTRYNLPEAKQKELGQMINAESKRLARMITNFLDVEKLGAGQMELRLSRFPIADLIDTCYQRAFPLAERKRITVTRRAAADQQLSADRELMEYALYNLLTNAIKYSPPETDVVVTAETSPSETRLAVTDNGIGMDPSEQKNLFRKFYRTRRAEASGETGTGIGLSIVREIVNHHGGRIDVHSAPGQGSTFTIILPAQ